MNPTPWYCPPCISANGFNAVKSADAPAAIGIIDHAVARFADKLVAGFTDLDHAEAICTMRNTLEAGIVSPESWEAVRKAHQRFAAVAGAFGEVIVSDTLHGDDPSSDGGRWLMASFRSSKGRQITKKIGLTLHGDGSDTRANAEYISALPMTAAAWVADHRDEVIAIRQIARTIVVIDADRASWFDGHDWIANDFGDVSDRDSGNRLGDLIAGTDGTWVRSTTGTTDIAPDARDYRAHKLHRADRAERFVILVPPEIQAGLKEAAVKFGGDMGRAVATLLGQTE